MEARGSGSGRAMTRQGWALPGEAEHVAKINHPGPEADHPLALVGLDLNWTDRADAGGRLTAALRLPDELPEQARVEGAIFHGERLVTRQVREDVAGLPSGSILQWPLAPLPLLAGAYEVRVSLTDSGSGQEVLEARHGLVVRSTQQQGAGLVFTPARWEV